MKHIKLDDIDKKKQPFQVPDGYFEDLPGKIQARIQKEKAERVVWLNQPRVRVAVALAAMLVIVLNFVFFDRSITPEQMLADVSEEELLAYIDLVEFEESEILAAFQGSIESIDFETDFETMELEDESLDDLILEYGLTDDYL